MKAKSVYIIIDGIIYDLCAVLKSLKGDNSASLDIHLWDAYDHPVEVTFNGHGTNNGNMVHAGRVTELADVINICHPPSEAVIFAQQEADKMAVMLNAANVVVEKARQEQLATLRETTVLGVPLSLEIPALPAPQPAPAPASVPSCPKCGYTYVDCLIHGDHHLCGAPNPPKPADDETVTIITPIGEPLTESCNECGMPTSRAGMCDDCLANF